MAFVYPSPPAIFPSSLLSFSPPFLPPLQPYFFLPFYPSVRRFLPAVSPLFFRKTIVASLETAYVFASQQDAARDG